MRVRRNDPRRRPLHDYLLIDLESGRDVAGFAQDDAGVDVALSDGGALRAQYLVGCDGGRSAVRKAAGIEFAGWDATTSNLIAEVEMTEEPELGTREDARGIHGLGKVEYEIVAAQLGRWEAHNLRPRGEFGGRQERSQAG